MTLNLVVLLALTALQPAQSTADVPLHQVILAQDSALFGAFNDCDLETWKRYLAKDIEFYQDNDEVTTTREALVPSFLDRCDENGVSHLRRELVASEVEVHPIQGHGAVQLGRHRFRARTEDGNWQVVAEPRFVHLWRYQDGAWQITRVISYGH